MDINNEFWAVWMGIASIVHTWPKNQWFPSLPFTSREGSMSSPLSVNVKPVIRKHLLWFSRTLLCCGNDMIWICLLTNTISVACNYYNVEPQRVYKHCHEILHLTSLSGACDFMLIFTLLNLKNKYMYYWVYYKTISSISLPTILYITPDNFRVCKENPYMIMWSIPQAL